MDAPDEQKQVEALVAQPAITKTCKSIRSETLPLFYKANEFRFLDDGEVTLRGLSNWVRAIWSSRWPLVQSCTIESAHFDIVEHLCAEFKDFAEVEFDGDAPKEEDEESKLLTFMAKTLKDEEGEKGDGESQKTDEKESSQ